MSEPKKSKSDDAATIVAIVAALVANPNIYPKTNEVGIAQMARRIFMAMQNAPK